MNSRLLIDARWYGSPEPGTDNDNTAQSTKRTDENGGCLVHIAAGAVRDASEIEILRRENAKLTAENGRLLAEVLRVTAEVTRATTDIGRFEALASQMAEVQRLQSSKEYSTAEGIQSTGTSHTKAIDTTLVVSKRVGSVSTGRLKAMSESELENLDAALKRIVSKVCIDKVVFAHAAKTIQEELASVGLEFATSESFVAGDGWSELRSAQNTSLSDLARMDMLLQSSRCTTGPKWYCDEMFRVTKRLMELRGFTK